MPSHHFLNRPISLQQLLMESSTVNQIFVFAHNIMGPYEVLRGRGQERQCFCATYYYFWNQYSSLICGVSAKSDFRLQHSL